MIDNPLSSFVELLTIFPQPEIVRHGDVEIAIPVLDFGKIARIISAVGPTTPDTGEATDPDEAVAQTLSIALDLSIDQINSMPAELVRKAFAILDQQNRDFVDGPNVAADGKPQNRGKGKPQRWSDLLQLLASHGHPDIEHLTPAQARLYYEAHMRAEARERERHAITYRAAAHCDPKEFAKFLKQLQPIED